MRVHARTGIILALSVGMLAWFLRGANLREVWNEIQNGRVGLLALAVGVTGMTYVFRALRWQYLLQPLGHPPFSAVFRTTVIGFAASTLLPARAGEVVRPYLLARRAGFSASSAFATIILERLLDLVTVLLLFGFYLAFYTPAVADVGHKPDTERIDVARGEVHMKSETLELIRARQIKKGDVLTVAQIAGITGSKRTSELIP